MNHQVHIIVVTHNSASELKVCLDHLAKQTIPTSSLIIVDSGSDDHSYLDEIKCPLVTKVIKTSNIGFSRANNIGFREISPQVNGTVLFLNPDTFLPPTYISLAVNVLEENPEAAIVSGKLLGFDLDTKRPTGMLDSAGIFRAWYGRWYDRGQGEEDFDQYPLREAVPAVCGALMCCRLDALLPFDGHIFDPDFFLYKEDIELSLRLRAGGWKLVYDPRLVAYHCRGWDSKRTNIPYPLRLGAAENELLMYRKHPSPYILWALIKFLLVKIFRL